MLEKLPESQRLERRQSRRRAWLRNLESGSDGPRPIFLALDASLDLDLALDALPQGTWPAATQGDGAKGKGSGGEVAGSS